MDSTEKLTLLDGLPLSSSIAREVFHDAVGKYSEAFRQEEARKSAFNENREQAILKMEQPIVGVKDFALVDANRCIDARLSPNELDVSDLEDGRYYVEGFVPVELHQSNDRTDFREPLPLPNYDYGIDCGLSVSEWLVVFAAISELNSEEPTLCPFARVSNNYTPAFREESNRLAKERVAIDRLVGEVKCATLEDVGRFKAGRNIVIRELLRERPARSLQKTREKTQFDLVVFDCSEQPAFLPTGWKSSYWPAAETLEAARQWLGCTLEALSHWNESLLHGVEANDIVSISMASQVYNDAWLLSCHVRDNYGISNVPSEPSGDSPLEVTRYLDDLRQWIPESSSEVQGKWHKAGEAPPDGFSGPLIGRKTQLAKWVLVSSDDHRVLSKKLDDIQLWGRKNKRCEFAIWFQSPQRYAEANSRKLSETSEAQTRSAERR